MHSPAWGDTTASIIERLLAARLASGVSMVEEARLAEARTTVLKTDGRLHGAFECPLVVSAAQVIDCLLLRIITNCTPAIIVMPPVMDDGWMIDMLLRGD